MAGIQREPEKGGGVSKRQLSGEDRVAFACGESPPGRVEMFFNHCELWVSALGLREAFRDITLGSYCAEITWECFTASSALMNRIGERRNANSIA